MAEFFKWLLEALFGPTVEKPVDPIVNPELKDTIQKPSDLPESGHYASTDSILLNKEYAHNYATCIVDKKWQIEASQAAKKILSNRKRYEDVSLRSGVPWFMIAAIHMRESSFNFNTYLHNGDPLGQKTVHVPAGVGPFYIWEDAAVDALKGFHGISDWSLPSTFRRMEMYNGPGYRTGAGQATIPRNASPYIYSGTQFYKSGKYGADHVFLSNQPDDQLGCMALIKTLEASGVDLRMKISTPNADRDSVLLSLAESINQKPYAEKMIKLRKEKYPDSNPRYYGIIDFTQHSSKKRFHVLDCEKNILSSYLTSHGKGSDLSDTGYAKVFSNSDGSHCSSLGIYRTNGTYFGEHGLSLRLLGLESSNSNAFDRAIVLHGANYVSEDFVKQYGRVGRSFGCPAVDVSVYEELISQLQGGSFIIAHN